MWVIRGGRAKAPGVAGEITVGAPLCASQSRSLQERRGLFRAGSLQGLAGLSGPRRSGSRRPCKHGHPAMPTGLIVSCPGGSAEPRKRCLQLLQSACGPSSPLVPLPSPMRPSRGRPPTPGKVPAQPQQPHPSLHGSAACLRHLHRPLSQAPFHRLIRSWSRWSPHSTRRGRPPAARRPFDRPRLVARAPAGRWQPRVPRAQGRAVVRSPPCRTSRPGRLAGAFISSLKL